MMRTKQGKRSLTLMLLGSLLGLAMLSLAVGCTSIVEQKPDESIYPPEDDRPLDEAPEQPASTSPAVLLEGLVEPRGLWLEGEALWVTDAKAGNVLRVDAVDGSIVENVTGLNEPWAIVANGEQAFWTERAGGLVVAYGPGGPTKTLATGQVSPERIAVGGQYVYWLNAGAEQGNSWQDGSVRRTLISGTGSVEDLATGLTKPRCLQLSDDHVYVTLAEKPAKLVRIAVSGGVPEQVATATYEPFDCARDVSTGDVYWVTRNPNWPFSGWVNHTASSVMTTEPLSPSQAKVSHVGIDEQFAYWAYVDGVHRFRRDGSGVIESVALGVATGDFVVGQKAVFIADRLSGRIYRRDK